MTETRVIELERVIADAPVRANRLAEGIVRCERWVDDQSPFAVMLFDLRGHLPENRSDLLGFEEKYLGRTFFEGPKHLKWNQYVFFVVPNAKWSVVSQSSQRHWIENDTTYAKKIVMPDNAIRPLLYERKWGTKGGPTLGSPREQWLNALAPLGLDRVLFAKRRGPAVRAWIEGRNITPDATEGVDTGSSAEHSNEAQMIGEIEWREFREWPKPRHFEFSHINLIDGVNGTGKTGLLEAIEVFFCGETHRHGKDAAKNDVTARFIGSPNLVKLPSSPAAQRRRDLSWFGSYWRQKQELAKSFNRYIFFNSDAAFHLEQSNDSQQVVDALMNVALGEDATALWGRMKEYAKEFQEQGTQLRTQVDNLRKERDVARKEISRLEAIPKVAEHSDCVRPRQTD